MDQEKRANSFSSKPNLASVYLERKAAETDLKIRYMDKKDAWKFADIEDRRDAREDEWKRRKLELDFEIEKRQWKAEQRNLDRNESRYQASMERANRLEQGKQSEHVGPSHCPCQQR
ncbi:unnamed protein product [Calypogeia fissa]